MENNNANAQQPTAVLVQPQEPESAWETTKEVATQVAVDFVDSFAKAAGIALGVCLVLKAFGATVGKSEE